MRDLPIDPPNTMDVDTSEEKDGVIEVNADGLSFEIEVSTVKLYKYRKMEFETIEEAIEYAIEKEIEDYEHDAAEARYNNCYDY